MNRRNNSMLRVLHVGDLGQKQFGALYNTFERKLVHGLIRADFCVWEFSDKDLAKFLAPLGISRLGVRRMMTALTRTVDNFRPDLLVLSNTRKLPNEFIAGLRSRHPSMAVACYTCDPLFEPENLAHQQARRQVCDALFTTTGGRQQQELAAGPGARVHYLPNPTDPAIEQLDNSRRDDLPVDLLFCGTGEEGHPRTERIRRLRDSLPQIEFRIHGMLGTPRIRGLEYDRLLAQTRSALNINKQEAPLYSSDRLAQLMANGILCFIDRASELDGLLGEDAAIWFNGDEELRERILDVCRDDTMRRKVAASGRERYRSLFASEAVSRYLVEATLQLPWSRDYGWPVDPW
ncbi:MAG: glycosyltransferase family 1 protein [Gammaproteobacteria bacterium]|nr:MAG: glycosyltransferase family 1 protein [Gammaproteobacteria bacterium]